MASFVAVGVFDGDLVDRHAAVIGIEHQVRRIEPARHLERLFGRSGLEFARCKSASLRKWAVYVVMAETPLLVLKKKRGRTVAAPEG